MPLGRSRGSVHPQYIFRWDSKNGDQSVGSSFESAGVNIVRLHGSVGVARAKTFPNVGNTEINRVKGNFEGSIMLRRKSCKFTATQNTVIVLSKSFNHLVRRVQG